MPIETFPPVSTTPIQLPSFSDWGAKLVAPLGSSIMSKDGVFELAGRVYWIVALMLAAGVIFAAKNGYFTGRITPPNKSKEGSAASLGNSSQTSTVTGGSTTSNARGGSGGGVTQKSMNSQIELTGTQPTGGSLPTSSRKGDSKGQTTEKSFEVVSTSNDKSTVSTGASSTNLSNVSNKTPVTNLSTGNRNANEKVAEKSSEVITSKNSNSTVSSKLDVGNSATLSGVDAYASGIDKSADVFSKKSAGSNQPSIKSTVVSTAASLNNLVNTNTSSEPNMLSGNNTPMPNDFLTDSLSLGSGFDPSVRPNFDALSKTIEGDVEKIHQNFDLCSQKLQSCKPGSSDYQALIDDFKRKAGNFFKVYRPYEKAFDASYFLTVTQYERILIELNDISRGIIRVKGDGNCLFHSFTEAFTRMKAYLVQFELWDARFASHEYLRGAVKVYMQKHYESDATLKFLIDDAIIAHVEAKKTDISLQKESEQYKLDFAQQLKNEGFEINEEDVKLKLLTLEAEENSLEEFAGPNKYTQYFTQFNEQGFFAAFAAAYSICKILDNQIGIRIADEPKDKITTEYNAFNEKAPILITLVFKGDHFDVKFPEGFLY